MGRVAQASGANEARYAPGWPTSARTDWAAAPSARSTPRPAVRWARPRAPWRSRRRSTTAWQPLPPTARSPRGSRRQDRRRPARRRSRPWARRVRMRARASPPSSRLPRRRSWWRVGGTTRARHEDARAKELSAATRSREATARDVRGLGGDARAREEPTGKREPDGGGRRVRSSAPTDWHSRAFASREVAEYDVSRPPSMTRRFPSAFLATPWQVAEFKSSMQSPMKTRFSKATALCEAYDPKSHAPGVSSRPRHRAHRRAGKTHERSKGESSDMPPRGMSAEVRALSSAPLRRGAQIREMRSETRATRGA